MIFEIPLRPISSNNAYSQNKQGRRFLTTQGKVFKEAVGYYALQAKDKRQSLDGDFAVEITYYFKDNRRRDVDGYNKLILDAFVGIFFEDDSQIIQLHLEKKQKCKEDRIVVNITKF